MSFPDHQAQNSTEQSTRQQDPDRLNGESHSD
jgi:hypothetical protein